MRLTLSLLLSLLLFTSTAFAETRVALVIGNSSYANSIALPNASNDALAMAKKFQDLGFEVVVGIDVDRKAMLERLKEFEQKLPGSDVAALFYSGHGFQVRSTNFLVPIDAKLDKKADVKAQTITLTAALNIMAKSAGAKLVFMDCNRDNPFGYTAKVVPKETDAPRAKDDAGIFLAFSTAAGDKTYEGSGSHTPFAAAVLKYIGTGSESIIREMVKVREDVFRVTDGAQTPFYISDMRNEFVLKAVAKQ
jgi:uncharacterized caspase-like protein